MTGYNVAHGHTAAVQLNLDNDREAFDRVNELIGHWVKWTGAEWAGVPAAAESIRYLVQRLRKSDKPEYAEIRDADLSEVNWTAIVVSKLYQANLDAGRDGYAGAPLTARMSENDCWTWILKDQSASVDHAIRYEGYSIEGAK